MTVRAKMKVTELHHLTYGKRVILSAQYDSTIPEDRKFQKATPTGRCEMMIDNPPAVEQFTIGKDFYLDFTPVE